MNEARREHSRLGLGIFVLLVVTYAAQFVIYAAVSPAVLRDPVMALVLSYAPMYCIALPAAYLIIRTVPKHPLEQHDLGAGRFFSMIVICWFLMYGGNMFGSFVNSIVSEVLGMSISDPVEDLLLSGIPMSALFVLTVIVAPFFEELIFRRLLIDRMNVYGQGTAVITSALMFGLFHGNLSQFFYATAIGLMFGYVYVKTGKLRYSVFMHMIINFWGGIVPALLMTDESVTALLNGNISVGDIAELQRFMTLPVILFALYSIATLGLAVAGLVLSLVRRRRISLDTAEMQLPKGRVFSTVWLNTGMILFTLISCFAVMVFTIISEMLY